MCACVCVGGGIFWWGVDVPPVYDFNEHSHSMLLRFCCRCFCCCCMVAWLLYMLYMLYMLYRGVLPLQVGYKIKYIVEIISAAPFIPQ